MRGILFSAPMVRAILAGTKTQTRRLVKWPIKSESDGCKRRLFGERDIDEVNHLLSKRQRIPLHRVCTPFGIGSRLYLKEGWAAPHDCDHLQPSRIPPETRIHYRATWDGPSGLLWRSPLFLPERLSRLKLRVTDIRLERLGEIFWVDARAEGVAPAETTHGDLSYTLGFIDTWDEIHGCDSWERDRDKWVWVVGFDRSKT